MRIRFLYFLYLYDIKRAYYLQSIKSVTCPYFRVMSNLVHAKVHSNDIVLVDHPTVLNKGSIIKMLPSSLVRVIHLCCCATTVRASVAPG